jgi:hypothetical protein
VAPSCAALARVAALAIVVAWSSSAHADLPSPGPLANAHASIDNEDDCGKCHTSGKYVGAQLCLSCHKDLGAEMSAHRGLHGKQYQGQACEACHVDHLGRNAKLVKWPGGVMDKLDHGLTGYPLDGAHRTVTCAKCHTTRSKLGAAVFLNTSTACGACHRDPHQNRFTAQCTRCHDVVAWDRWDHKQFDHKLARYALTGQHTTVECAKCHGNPAKWQPVAFATCDSVGCHADPHKGQFKPTPCAKCHNTDGWKASGEMARRDHPKLSLANGHASVACKTCHDRGNDKPPTKGSTCVSCHPKVHSAPFGINCVQCHASIRWIGGVPETVARAAHDKTPYPLAGKHATVACDACHLKSRPEAQRYRAVKFDTCGACHEDAHKGEFQAIGDCAQCHSVAGFAPTTFGVTQHAATGYTLDGEHAATPCGACHPGSRPRLNWQLAQSACIDCHENPHGDQFAKEMLTGSCSHCHTAYSWNQVKIDHSTFPLTGAHARTRCEACHGAQKQGAEAAAYRGIPRECEGCHEDTHAGQFRQTDPVEPCKQCHGTAVWKIEHFDHDKTRYPLDGAHIKLACDQCHPKTTLRDGSDAVRWRLGYFHCKDCHADPHTPASPK